MLIQFQPIHTLVSPANKHAITMLRRMPTSALMVIALLAMALAALLFVPPSFAQDGEQPADNQPPTLLVAGVNQYESRLPRGVSDASVAAVVEGRVMEFQAHADEPECEQISFTWQQTGGPDAGSLAQQDWINLAAPGEQRQCWARSTMRFTAPPVDADTELTFRATATDSGGNAANATVTVWVLDGNGADNTPPTAIIAGSQATEIPAGQQARLVGDGSDAETHHLNLGYLWTQTGGPIVELERADSLNAGFVAPETTEALGFRLTVTDPGGLTGSADVSITVTDADLTPDYISFGDYYHAIPDQIAASDVVTVKGIKGVAPLTVSAPAEAEVNLYVNGDHAPHITGVSNGDTLELEARASLTFAKTVIVSVTVGDTTTDWRITTRATAGPGDA